MATEWRKIWPWYIPKDGLEGKTVLDLGAGCGETAYLFFKHGAKRVVAVEPNPVRAANFEKNVRRFGWDAKLYPRGFQPSDMDVPHDFLKSDTEGWEQLMLDAPDKIGQATVEVHTHYLEQRFRALGFREVHSIDKGVGKGMMINW